MEARFGALVQDWDVPGTCPCPCSQQAQSFALQQHAHKHEQQAVCLNALVTATMDVLSLSFDQIMCHQSADPMCSPCQPTRFSNDTPSTITLRWVVQDGKPTTGASSTRLGALPTNSPRARISQWPLNTVCHCCCRPCFVRLLQLFSSSIGPSSTAPVIFDKSAGQTSWADCTDIWQAVARSCSVFCLEKNCHSCLQPLGKGSKQAAPG